MNRFPMTGGNFQSLRKKKGREVDGRRKMQKRSPREQWGKKRGRDYERS